MSIGDRLKMIRKDMGLSQAKFAGELSIHLRSYVSYEQGHRSIPQNVMLELLERGYDIHWLLTGEGTMKSFATTGDMPHPEYSIHETIPLISSVDNMFTDNDLPDIRANNRINRPQGNKDPFLYALKIGVLEDRSMLPAFSPDEIIILSPMETVKNNDKALVKLKDGRKLFRVVQFKDYDIELISTNPDYPTITIPSNHLIFAHKVIGSLKL